MGEQVLLIDTNIFLEVLLEQQHAKECLLFFERVSVSDYRVALTNFSLYSIGLKLEKRNMQEPFKHFLSDAEVSNFILVNVALHDENEILSICVTQHLTFDDAHQYWAAKKLSARLVSFDADFDKTDLHRFEPAEILKEL